MIQAKLTALSSFFLDADNEAAHTLTEAYRGSNALYYNHQNSKDSSDTSFALFKAIIRSLSLASRDFAMQVEGCKGVILWSSSNCENQYKALKWKLPMILGLNKALVSSNSILRGVILQEQNKGYGTALMEYVLNKADEAGLPVCAEIAEPSMMSLFSHFDFIERGMVSISKNTTIHIMVRNPKGNSESFKTLDIRPGRRGSDASV
ncbi:hypothetical protein INT43_001209 [Umbelopsis isabellina]|uniref:N-acetyltransferase domain-containing protein n=1 Tax=Mortierella isabellina TaxID=91625 RepID=A0A8H7PK82_MORIS|nr:hypothetical protein INT43_001209 [Umbelopsis isabellina]